MNIRALVVCFSVCGLLIAGGVLRPANGGHGEEAQRGTSEYPPSIKYRQQGGEVSCKAVGGTEQ